MTICADLVALPGIAVPVVVAPVFADIAAVALAEAIVCRTADTLDATDAGAKITHLNDDIESAQFERGHTGDGIAELDRTDDRSLSSNWTMTSAVLFSWA